MDHAKLKKILDDHKLWLKDNGGKCAYLSGANLSGAYLRGASLRWADLRETNLHRADLTEANLSGADLTGADLSGADLTEADLTEAGLSGANLSEADLSGADLSGADLCCAKLTGADLREANLRGADLCWANLTGAKLPENYTDLATFDADPRDITQGDDRASITVTDADYKPVQPYDDDDVIVEHKLWPVSYLSDEGDVVNGLLSFDPKNTLDNRFQVNEPITVIATHIRVELP